MKGAVIRGHRTLADGHKLVNVVCPVCDHRHWVPVVVNTHQCPRRPGEFILEQENNR